MNVHTRIGLVIATVVLTLGLATTAYTQFGSAPGQGGAAQGTPPPRPPLHATMHAGTQGVFVLDGATLTKYTLGTLVVQGTLPLAVSASPTTETTPGTPPQGPPPVGTFLIAGKDDGLLLVVLGDTFYKIDATTLTLTAKTALPAIPRPEGAGPGKPNGERSGASTNRPPQGGRGGQGGPGAQGGQERGPGGPGQGQGGPGQGQGGPGMGGPGGPPPAPSLEVHGNYLYILRGNQVTAINIDDATLAGKTVTPVVLQ